jgi:hemerythrin-like domain-containing protein
MPKEILPMRATDILRDEHRVIEQVLSCLEVLADGARVAGALDGAAARDALDFFQHFADGCHHAKEEACLFPALESRGFDPHQGPTGVMRVEHVLGRHYLRALRSDLEAVAQGDAPAVSRFAENAAAFARLLREHIAKEDQRLFPMADRTLSDRDQQALLGSFEQVEGHEAGAHEHYLAVADALAERFQVRRARPAGHTCCGHHRP